MHMDTVQMFIRSARSTCLARETLTRGQQAGFRPVRGCVDQTFTFHQVLQRRHMYKRPTILVFLDFQGIFDSIDQDEERFVYNLTEIMQITQRRKKYQRNGRQLISPLLSKKVSDPKKLMHLDGSTLPVDKLIYLGSCINASGLGNNNSVGIRKTRTDFVNLYYPCRSRDVSLFVKSRCGAIRILTRLGQPGIISTLVLLSCGMADRHRKDATAERFRRITVGDFGAFPEYHGEIISVIPMHVMFLKEINCQQCEQVRIHKLNWLVQSRERVENVVVVQTSLPLLDCVYIRYSFSFEAIRSYLPKSTTNESEKYNQRTACIWFTIDADLGFGSCAHNKVAAFHNLQPWPDVCARYGTAIRRKGLAENLGMGKADGTRHRQKSRLSNSPLHTGRQYALKSLRLCSNQQLPSSAAANNSLAQADLGNIRARSHKMENELPVFRIVRPTVYRLTPDSTCDPPNLEKAPIHINELACEVHRRMECRQQVLIYSALKPILLEYIKTAILTACAKLDTTRTARWLQKLQTSMRCLMEPQFSDEESSVNLPISRPYFPVRGNSWL
ncbi:hypothetical protein CLF_107295 [Clonorchis sinensis]|uniref:Reverse transcriptase domain-containing protein n=1 Tax=Clonorchis sinensis TaxID=79923 RepID=G7YQI7_CLOSI|nr:hypothetical protein CLF_107295 [Clonorchis sinensis]